MERGAQEFARARAHPDTARVPRVTSYETAFWVGLALTLAGAAVTQWVTGGRGAFGGWFLDARARRKRRALIQRRFPVVGGWFLPVGYAVALVGVVVMGWGAFNRDW